MGAPGGRQLRGRSLSRSSASHHEDRMGLDFPGGALPSLPGRPRGGTPLRLQGEERRGVEAGLVVHRRCGVDALPQRGRDAPGPGPGGVHVGRHARLGTAREPDLCASWRGRTGEHVNPARSGTRLLCVGCRRAVSGAGQHLWGHERGAGRAAPRRGRRETSIRVAAPRRLLVSNLRRYGWRPPMPQQFHRCSQGCHGSLRRRRPCPRAHARLHADRRTPRRGDRASRVSARLDLHRGCPGAPAGGHGTRTRVDCTRRDPREGLGRLVFDRGQPAEAAGGWSSRRLRVPRGDELGLILLRLVFHSPCVPLGQVRPRGRRGGHVASSDLCSVR